MTEQQQKKLVTLRGLSVYDEELMDLISTYFLGEETRSDLTYAPKSTAVTGISYDINNKKLKKTINGTDSDIVTAQKIIEDGVSVLNQSTINSGTENVGKLITAKLIKDSIQNHNFYWRTLTN